MKSRRSSPHAELVRMSTLTVNTGTDSADLKIDEIFANMNGPNGFSPLVHDSHHSRSGTPILNGTSHDPYTPPRRSTSGKLLTSSSRSPDQLAARGPSPISTNGDAAVVDGGLSSPWSSAVGRATTGKSGRVIEKLQAENDRLRREFRLEALRREEEQKKGEMARGKMESLQAANDHLVQMREAEKASLARRGRKVEELKADLESERGRRSEAERHLKTIMTESERTEEGMKRQLREEVERAKKATSQYDVLSSSWRQLDDGYRRKTERLKREMTQLNTDYTEDRHKLERMEIIIEQQRQEIEKMRLAKEAVSGQYDAYQREMEESTRAMRERASKNEQAQDKALEETLHVLGEMRHVINIKKFVRDAD
ncbi:MAG: hypothetical protein M1833_004365 [Piccolia ochrophora]|nr:MAG: hypothetical protein M1833_004365 [Piccolia ochrophora]